MAFNSITLVYKVGYLFQCFNRDQMDNGWNKTEALGLCCVKVQETSEFIVVAWVGHRGYCRERMEKEALPLEVIQSPKSFMILLDRLLSVSLVCIAETGSSLLPHCAAGKGGRRQRQIASFQGYVLFCLCFTPFLLTSRRLFLFTWLLLAVMLSAKPLGSLLLKAQNARLDISWQIPHSIAWSPVYPRVMLFIFSYI